MRASSSPRSAWIVGPHPNVLLVAKEIADSHIVGVRLRPGVVPRVLGVPATELQGQLVDLDSFWGHAVDDLRERLFETRDPRARATLLEQAIHDRASASANGDAARVRALRIAMDRAPASSVGQIADRFGLTHRRVIALFDHHVGLKPKEYQRVRRLRAAMRRTTSRERPGFARVAYESGYADQAHLTHEFRRLTGLTPTEFEARRSPVGEGVVRYRLAGQA